MPTNKHLTDLVINKVESQAVYDYMVTNNLINNDELYLVGGESTAVLYTPQTLTDKQKEQARANIGAISVADIPEVPVTSVAGKTGAVTLTKSDVGLDNVTNESKTTMFASPDFTGTPTAPTAENTVDNTQIATTAFVHNVVGAISAADLGLEQAMKFLGTTTTDISDASNIDTIIIGSGTVKVEAGNVVLYNGYEYVWTGSAWEQLGQEGSFVLKSTTINGKTLNNNITLTAGDVSAYTKAEVDTALYATQTSIDELSTDVAYINSTDNENVGTGTEEVSALITTIDSALSETSTNPVQNKVVTESINQLSKEIANEATNRKNAITTEQKDRVNAIAVEKNRATARENEIEALFTAPTQEAVDNWLNGHPEVTTTVQDKSLEVVKFTEDAKKYIVKDYIIPQMFGAVGDGVTDDTEAIQLMLNETKAGSTIFFPSGTYLLNPFGTQQSNVYGYYGALLYQKENVSILFGEGAVLKSVANSNNTDHSSLLGVVRCSNIKVIGGELLGELDEHTFASEIDTTTFNQIGIGVSSSSNVVVDGLTSHNFIAACIHVGGNLKSNTVEIRNCLAYHSHYHAIVVEGADNVKIINTTAYDANTNRNFGTSIDIEGISVENVNENITIEGCYFGAAETSALNVNKCKNVHIRNTQIVGANLSIQQSENVFVSGCYMEGAAVYILHGGSKNIVIDSNKLFNHYIRVQVYSSDASFQDGVIIRNNTIVFNSAFESRTEGIAFFHVLGNGRSDITIVNNVCRCSSGRIRLVNAIGGDGGRGVVMSGNKFFVGAAGNEVSQIYRELIGLYRIRTDFTGNEIEIHLANTVAVAGTGSTSELNLLFCVPNGIDCFKFSNNDIRIFGDTATSITALNLLKTYTELTEAPNARYVDFFENKIFSEAPNTRGLLIPQNYKARVYSNIVTSGLTTLTNETQSGITAQGNIYDTLS